MTTAELSEWNGFLAKQRRDNENPQKRRWRLQKDKERQRARRALQRAKKNRPRPISLPTAPHPTPMPPSVQLAPGIYAVLADITTTERKPLPSGFLPLSNTVFSVNSLPRSRMLDSLDLCFPTNRPFQPFPPSSPHPPSPQPSSIPDADFFTPQKRSKKTLQNVTTDLVKSIKAAAKNNSSEVVQVCKSC